MKYFFFSFIISLLVGASVCCAPPPAKTADQLEKSFIESLQEKTVALIKEDDEGTIYPYCAGVWVAKNLILTAHHCFRGEGSLIRYKTIKDKDGSGRIAFPVKMDELSDLILLKAVDAEIPNHPIASVSKMEWTGEKVHIIGHPNGLWWTYFSGEISSRRKTYDSSHEKYQKFLQISAPVWKGNSGGGAFDKDGNLVGISSWIMIDIPLMSFFVHRDSIFEFLAGTENI